MAIFLGAVRKVMEKCGDLLHNTSNGGANMIQIGSQRINGVLVESGFKGGSNGDVEPNQTNPRQGP
jgi:hypothetical protein